MAGTGSWIRFLRSAVILLVRSILFVATEKQARYLNMSILTVLLIMSCRSDLLCLACLNEIDDLVLHVSRSDSMNICSRMSLSTSCLVQRGGKRLFYSEAVLVQTPILDLDLFSFGTPAAMIYSQQDNSGT